MSLEEEFSNDIDSGMLVEPQHPTSTPNIDPNEESVDNNMGVIPEHPNITPDLKPDMEDVLDKDMGVIPSYPTMTPDYRPEGVIPDEGVDENMGTMPLPPIMTPDLNPPETKPPLDTDNELDLEDAFSNTGMVQFQVGNSIGEKTEFKLPSELKNNVIELGCNDNSNMLNLMLNNITGVKLIGNYFNIRGDRHEATTSQSIELDGTLQAYNLVINAVLFASKALDETKLEEANIEAILAIGIVPRLHDYFAFSSFDKRLFFFEVAEIERLGYGGREVFKLNLEYRFSSVTGMEKIEDMMSKVVDTYYYDHNSQTLGEQSLLSPEDLAMKEELGSLYEDMMNLYDNMFLDPNYGIYNLYSSNAIGEKTNFIVYDANVAKFFQSLVCFNDNVFDMTKQTPDYREANRYINFYKALRHKQPTDPRTLHPYYSVGELGQHYIDPYLKNILQLRGCQVVVEYKTEDMLSYPRLDLIHYRNYDKNLIHYPLQYKGKDDTNYIFSEAFYKLDTGNMTEFEKLMVKLLNKEPINYHDYQPYFKSYRYWSAYEMYYLIPVMIYVIRKLRKGITNFK